MNASPSTLRPEIAALLPRLRRFARALDGTDAEADALVHGAIDRALDPLEPSPDGVRLDHRLLRRMADAHRDAARAPGDAATDADAPGEADLQAVAGSDGDAIAALADGRLSQHPIASAMRRLPVDQRIAIALVLVDGLSWRAAAELLEIRVGVLTTRLLHGRDALLQALDEPGATAARHAQGAEAAL